MIARKPQTGPLPHTSEIAQAERMVQSPLSEHVKASAMIYLNDMRDSDPKMSRDNMLDNLVIQYGFTVEQAGDVINDWKKVKA